MPVERTVPTSRHLYKMMTAALERQDAVSIFCDSIGEWIEVKRVEEAPSERLVTLVGPDDGLTTILWRDIAAVRAKPLSDYRGI